MLRLPPGIDTPVTGIVTAATVTVIDAVRFPSTVLTVMLLLPADIALTRPFALTVATAVLLDSHVTFWFVALAGATVADN